jgi:exodeoxyribonuclease-1
LEHHEIFIKLNPDVVPSPGAFLTHKIDLEWLQSNGYCEYEAIKKIHDLCNVPGTITIGYNNLGFDDEFLRFAFYRNLLDPYSHQYAQGCHRMDLYPMIVIYYLFKSDVLLWPKIAQAPSLRLEHLNEANGLLVGKAHDAKHDVLVTVALARRLYEARDVWDYLGRCFDKTRDAEKLKDYGEGLLIEGSMGAARSYQTIAICLGRHKHYKNQSLWLPLDKFPLSEVTKDNFIENTFVIRKRFGEPPILLPLEDKLCRHLIEERLELAQANRSWLKANRELFLTIVNYYRNYQYPKIPGLDVDAALYQNGFLSDRDHLECSSFHLVSIRDKIIMLDKFSNVGLRSQALRVLGRNYPEYLTGHKQLHREFKEHLLKFVSSDSIIDYKNGQRFNRNMLPMEIARLCKESVISNQDMKLLDRLTKYIQSQ